MLKLGLTQRVAAIEARAERRDCLDQAWTRSLTATGYLPIPLPNVVEDVETLVTELALDGIILTGGNDLVHLPGAGDTAPERDSLEHRLIDLAAVRRLPLLGVCRGLQILVHHHGGTLSPVTNHVGTTHRITVRSDVDIPLTDRDEVNSFHNFGVREDDIGQHLQVLATAPDGTVEAVRHRRLPQWGILWHPERPPRDPRDLDLLRALFERGPR